jgi:hypothetical protein
MLAVTVQALDWRPMTHGEAASKVPRPRYSDGTHGSSANLWFWMRKGRKQLPAFTQAPLLATQRDPDDVGLAQASDRFPGSAKPWKTRGQLGALQVQLGTDEAR